MKQAFTIDLEDWYQGIGLPLKIWPNYEKRLRYGFDILMNLLLKYNVKATFFTVGKIFEDYPDVIKEIVQSGHEIACHTYSHPMIYNITPTQFEEELVKCIDLAKGFNVTLYGFRAPFFSIDTRSWWALDLLKKNGFSYDSSIYPGDNKRTGIVGYNKNIHHLNNGLLEIPISTIKMYKYDIGLGGAYFRILPYAVFKRKMKKLSDERIAIFYIHPWELDKDHPVLNDIPPRIRYPHYFNLSKTKVKLEKLLNDFEFTSLNNIVDQHKRNNGL